MEFNEFVLNFLGLAVTSSVFWLMVAFLETKKVRKIIESIIEFFQKPENRPLLFPLILCAFILNLIVVASFRKPIEIGVKPIAVCLFNYTTTLGGC